MKNMHIIIHESFESAGAIEWWAQNKKSQVHYTRTYAGDKLPENAETFDSLIVMGGPQSPDTTKDECPHFDSAAEQMLIRHAIEADKMVLGVCLGAQLIGAALGAKCERSPQKEIGVFDLNLTQAAMDDPVFSKFPQTFSVAHWHGDMPGLTKDAQILAYSKGCPRQVIRYAPKVYGFQCHFEFTKKTVEDMIAHCGHEIAIPSQYIQDANTLRSHHYDDMNQLICVFLDDMHFTA